MAAGAPPPPAGIAGPGVDSVIAGADFATGAGGGLPESQPVRPQTHPGTERMKTKTMGHLSRDAFMDVSSRRRISPDNANNDDEENDLREVC
jgi:hypothetical protein